MLKRVTIFMLCSMGVVSTKAVWADDFTITGATATTNGGNTVDGGDSITVTSDGSVTTTGNNNNALSAAGNSNVVTNNGALATDGINAHGIYSTTAENTVITNTGSITTSGSTAYGMYILGDSYTISNSGTITATGATADGIHVEGDNSIITNSGTVISNNGFSISIEGTGSTLNLESGSILVGDVYFDSTDTTLNVTGFSAVIQADSSSEIPNTINALSGVYTVSDNTIYVAELSDYAAQDRVLNTLTRFAHDAVADRDTNEKGYWNSVLATLLRDSGNDAFSGYDGLLFSSSLGLDRVGKPSLFVGLSIDQIEGDDNFETNSISVHAGTYDKWREADYVLLTGVSYHGATREQTNNTLSSGEEEASSHYFSVFISPSLSYSNLWLDGDLIRLRYIGAYNSSHKFDFSDGDLTVEGRLNHQLEARLAMQNLIKDISLQYGADIGYIDGNIDVTLAGNSVSGSTPADESYSRLFLNIDIGNSQFDAGYSTSKELSLTYSYSF